MERDHVLSDLRPYVCTFLDCPLADTTFDSRKEFEFHEISEHYIHMVKEGVLAKAAEVEEMSKNPPPPAARKSKFRQMREMLHRMTSSPKPEISPSSSSSPGRKPHSFRLRPDRHAFNIDCVFCGEELLFGCDALGGHVGRHMEEIAFAIVSRPHGVWDFYSEASSVGSQVVASRAAEARSGRVKHSGKKGGKEVNSLKARATVEEKVWIDLERKRKDLMRRKQEMEEEDWMDEAYDLT